MTERSREQIIIDALTVERGKLEKRMNKIKTLLSADPLLELIEVRKAVVALDLKTPAGLEELGKLAAKEKECLAAIERRQKMDYVKQSNIQFDLEMEIASIDRIISSYAAKQWIRGLHE